MKELTVRNMHQQPHIISRLGRVTSLVTGFVSKVKNPIKKDDSEKNAKSCGVNIGKYYGRNRFKFGHSSSNVFSRRSNKFSPGNSKNFTRKKYRSTPQAGQSYGRISAMSNSMNKPYRARPLEGIEAIILCLIVAVAIMCMVCFTVWVTRGTGPALDSRDHFQQQQTNQILQQGD